MAPRRRIREHSITADKQLPEWLPQGPRSSGPYSRRVPPRSNTLSLAPQSGPEARANAPSPAPDVPAAAAIPQLVELHGPRLFSLASRLCGNTSDAEDMVQDVFLQALRKWHTFKGHANPGTWLYAIAARSCKARLRRKGGIDRRMPAASQLLPWSETKNADLGAGVSRAAEGPVAQAIQHEAAKAVHDAILTLPEHFRVPLVLKDMLELSIEDVAAALNIKPETVKTRVHRSRLLLRKAIMNRRALPKHAAKAPIYERQVCLDLLKAKLDAMDHGRGFPIGRNVVCERCLAVFAELDLSQDACANLSKGILPARVRAKILTAIRQGQETSNTRSPRPKRTGGKTAPAS